MKYLLEKHFKTDFIHSNENNKGVKYANNFYKKKVYHKK